MDLGSPERPPQRRFCFSKGVGDRPGAVAGLFRRPEWRAAATAAAETITAAGHGTVFGDLGRRLWAISGTDL
ncbi:hypothetical protein MTO96_005702 [Rhipicephalus appendiculatus]